MTETFNCGYEKLDKKGRDQVLKLMAWLHEKAVIEKRFKNKPSAWLCRECASKTGYTIRDLSGSPPPTDCELCRDAETPIGLSKSWERKEHWEGEGRP